MDTTPLSPRQCSIIICLAESDRKDGREGDLGIALHFFSCETQEDCGALLESVNSNMIISLFPYPLAHTNHQHG